MDKKLKYKICKLRDNTCEFCKERFSLTSLDLHHRLRKSQGGGDEQWNLVVLCRKCHTKVHNNVSGSIIRGFFLTGYLGLSRILDEKQLELFTNIQIGNRFWMIPNWLVKEIK